MHTLHLQRYRNKQRGGASIIMAIVLLFAITIVSIFTARTTIMEQKISANEIRTKQAFEAASAGLQHLVAHAQGGVDQVTDGTLDTVFVDVNGDSALVVADDSNTATLTNGSSYTLSLAGVLDTSAASTITLTSTGLSDDGLGSRTITQDIIVSPAVGGLPSHPVISKNVMGITGNVTLTNMETNATVWSGSSVTVSGSGSTWISDGGSPAAPIQSSSSTVTGVDVIENDPVLAGATNDEFFENFFNGTREYIKTTSDIVATSAAEIENQFGQKIWHDGNLSYNGDDIGCNVATTPCPSANQSGGILVVDGDLSTTGNTNFYGLLYVTGNLSVAGTFSVIGAVIIEGSKTGAGNFDVTYDSSLADGGDDVAPNIASTNGTWKDF